MAQSSYSAVKWFLVLKDETLYCASAFFFFLSCRKTYEIQPDPGGFPSRRLTSSDKYFCRCPTLKKQTHFLHHRKYIRVDLRPFPNLSLQTMKALWGWRCWRSDLFFIYLRPSYCLSHGVTQRVSGSNASINVELAFLKNLVNPDTVAVTPGLNLTGGRRKKGEKMKAVIRQL